MKVYTLLGFVQYEGSTLLGVFTSISDVIQYIKSPNRSKWYYDDVGYIESELGEGINDVEGNLEYYFENI